MAHLEQNNLISDKQQSFQWRRSTLTNLQVDMENLTLAIDQQIPVDVNYMECKKASDTVPHYTRLLMKLEALGAGGKLLGWSWARPDNAGPKKTQRRFN